MAYYVVTGGAGFIGSHIVRRLAADGHEVRAVDNLATGHAENLNDLREAVKLIEGSVLDAALLRRAFKSAEVVFHQAALASVQRSVQDPLTTNRVNVEGTLQVLEAARACGVRRVVYASSSSVYGNLAVLPKREDLTPAPESPYAVSKLVGELYCRNYTRLFSLETVSLRYFNVFGPWQDPESQYAAVVPIFVKALLSGRSPRVFGDGEQSRDFTYVDNVVEANTLAASAPGAAGMAFNVGCGARYTLNELLGALRDIIGADVEATYADERPGDVRHSQADISRAQQILGYEPRVGLREGLKRTVAWYQTQRSGGHGRARS